LEQSSRSIDTDGQSDAIRDIEIATPVAGFICITTCNRWMIQGMIILHKQFCRFYDACPESKDTNVLYNIFNLQKRH
jgi:hypothetical protein